MRQNTGLRYRKSPLRWSLCVFLLPRLACETFYFSRSRKKIPIARNKRTRIMPEEYEEKYLEGLRLFNEEES